jgi:hypothetical protein
MSRTVRISYNTTLAAYDAQVRQLPEDIQTRECGLIEAGRAYAREFDDGHRPSLGGVVRVLADLRRLVKQDAKVGDGSVVAWGELEALRERRAARNTGP